MTRIAGQYPISSAGISQLAQDKPHNLAAFGLISDSELESIEGLFEVGKKIAPVFDAHRDTDEPISDAGFDRFFLGVARVRGGLWMTG